jgi:uncharacterized protein YqgC (DUF456 family)
MAVFFPIALTPAPAPQGGQQLFQILRHWIAEGVAAVSTYGTQVATALTHLPAQVTPALEAPALWHSVLYWCLVLVMLAGVVGSMVPALPGITLVFAAVLVWGFAVGFAGIKLALGVAIAAWILGFVIDYLAGILGAQRVGASKWGQIGAILGMVLGLFGLLPLLPTGIPLLGLVAGTVLGAFIGEFLHRRELDLWPRVKQSGKVGIAIVVGTLIGNLLQGVLALITLGVFMVTAWPY